MKRLALIMGLIVVSTPVYAAGTEKLIRDFDDPAKADAALEALVKKGMPAVRHLIGEAAEGRNLTRRGWAIVALGRIGGADADRALMKIHTGKRQPTLVRTWAAAARIEAATQAHTLVELSALATEFPAVKRPLEKRFSTLASTGSLSAAELISVVARMPQLQGVLLEPILALGVDRLVKVMVRARDDPQRRLAAAFLATAGARGKADEVAVAVVKAYRYDVRSPETPWTGGALFVPSIQWKPGPARELTDSLMAWYVFAAKQNDSGTRLQIHNNLRGVGLAAAAGYRSPGWNDPGVERWLKVWVQARGAGAVRDMLKKQGALGKYGAAAGVGK